MTTTAHARPATQAPCDPGIGAAFGSEWLKLRTARAPRRNLVLGIVLGVAVSALLAVVIGVTADQQSEADRAAFDPILYPLTGSVLTAIFYAVVGVNAVASEYRSGMIRLTLAASPRRGRVLAAKALVVALATGVAGTVAAVAMLAVSQVIYAAYDLPTVGPADGDLWRTLLLMGATGPVFPLLGVALAFLFRSSAAALSTVLALIFAPSIFGELLPVWWQRNIVSLLPGPASDSLVIGHLTESPMYRHPAAATAVVLAWLVAALVGALLLLERRDA